MPVSAPNIVLIHCHDLGDFFGSYPGNSAITPVLDELAGEGVVLDGHFAAAPQCSPSRASMMTGLAPHRHGLMGLQNRGVWNMSAKVPTIANLLRDRGYQTASFGIWHISADLESHGIDEWDEAPICEDGTVNALRFLNERDTAKPFFLLVGFFEPHRAYTDRWDDLQDPASLKIPPYLPDIAATREEMSRFYGDVSRVDRSVGQILHQLDADGLRDDTLLIFTTDHGIAMPLAKGTLYDPGLKIGAILRWPGRIDPGSRFSELTSNVDLLPTILEAIGAGDDIPAGLDGISFWDALTGGKELDRDAIFVEMTWHDFYEPMRAIRTAGHKLIRNFEVRDGLQVAADIRLSPIIPHMRWELRGWKRPEFELYDLEADPHERHNLAGDPSVADIESGLNLRLTEYLQATDDPILAGPIDISDAYHDFVVRAPAGLP
jgi:arylsulfatase A-like enzyme